MLFVHCLLLFAASACGGGGGGNNASGPAIADLGGERVPDVGPALPAFDAAGAPTDAHRILAGLLPLEALQRDTVIYDGWSDATSNLSNEDPAKAALPVVTAEYHSAGFKLHSEKPNTAEISYPQTCLLTLIRAPEPLAAGAIANNLRAALTSTSKGFTEQGQLALGQTRTGELPKMDRYLRIDNVGDTDKVYVAYVMVIGSLVVYALEIETPPALKGPGGQQIKRVIDGQRGTRIGGQLASLVYWRLNP